MTGACYHCCSTVKQYLCEATGIYPIPVVYVVSHLHV